MSGVLTLGYSPCPNDTFIFDALVHGRVEVDGLRFEERLEDVETLNRLAAEAALDVTKISYGAIPGLLRDYVLLRSGGALGRGCGPLVVARREMDAAELARARIAIPGRNTTANLLLRLFAPDAAPGVERVYSDIMPAVARGELDAGLIIHESRFTYPRHGLVRVVDLGDWWDRRPASRSRSAASWRGVRWARTPSATWRTASGARWSSPSRTRTHRARTCVPTRRRWTTW
jgi:1,4-dihydroxy-6-naphthoate synthase